MVHIVWSKCVVGIVDTAVTVLANIVYHHYYRSLPYNFSTAQTSGDICS